MPTSTPEVVVNAGVDETEEGAGSTSRRIQDCWFVVGRPGGAGWWTDLQHVLVSFEHRLCCGGPPVNRKPQHSFAVLTNASAMPVRSTFGPERLGVSVVRGHQGGEKPERETRVSRGRRGRDSLAFERRSRADRDWLGRARDRPESTLADASSTQASFHCSCAT
eukprot:1836965-Rhodomonas_salina.6